MKILWVTPQLPCKRSGGQTRQYNLLRHLSNKHALTVLSLVRQEEQKDLQALKELGIAVVPVDFAPPNSASGWANRFKSWTQLFFDPLPNYAHTYPLSQLYQRMERICQAQKPDLVHLELLFVAPLFEAAKGIACILTEQNVESRNLERQGRYAHTFLRRFSGYVEASKLQIWEQKMLRQFQTCIAVSKEDANDLQELASTVKYFTIPNGVDTDHFRQPSGKELQREGLVFFGNLGYPPNIDALSYFLRQIFPIVQKQCPWATLTILGPNASADIQKLGEIPGIRYIGFVEDLRPYLWQAEASIVPLRSGGGTRLKILESMAAGCPVISTTIGVEGLELAYGQDLVIADEPADFAAALIGLLQDKNHQNKLREAGQKAVFQKYDWRVLAPSLESAYNFTIEQCHLKD